MKSTDPLNHSVLLLMILLCVVWSVKSEIHTFTYNESKPDITGLPRVFSMDRLDDDTILLHIVHENQSTPTNDSMLCVNKYLSFRTISPDGLPKAIDILLDVQPINFCIFLSETEIGRASYRER